MPAEARPDAQMKTNGSARSQKRKDSDRADPTPRETGGRFRKPAGELDKLARVLRFTSDQVDGALSGTIARTAADVENAAQRLREMSTQDIVHTIEGFARRRPLAFLGVAALVGFGSGRFFKSSFADSSSTSRSTS